MGKRITLVTPLHKKTQRDYLGRMMNDKIACMKKAREFEFDYWDGDRKYGYGGYTYDGRWKSVAEKLISRYRLSPTAKILDVGCGKAHLLFELKKLLPNAIVVGLDISKHGIGDAPKLIRPYLIRYKAQDSYPWGDRYFDLVLSITTLHNLYLFDLESAVRQIERVGKNKYIVVEAYRNVEELFNLQCWALTASLFLTPKEWMWLYRILGYTGDYEFIYFE